MNLREALNVLWRRRSLILVVALLGPLAVWMVGRPGDASDETYSASVRITVPTTGDEGPISQYAFIATDTLDISDAVAIDLNIADPDGEYTSLDVHNAIEITPIPDINIMTISVENAPTAELAELLVERFGFHLIQHITVQREEQIAESEVALMAREERLREDVSELNASLDRARSRLSDADLEAGVSPDPVKEAELEVAIASLGEVLSQLDGLKLDSEVGAGALVRASEPSVTADPLASDPLGLNARLILGTVLGLAFGFGLAFALHRFDTRLYNRKDAESAFGLPVLAEIPKISWLHRRNFQMIARAQPEAPASEAYRLLRSSLAQAGRLMPVRARRAEDASGGTVVLVTSVSEQVGKSTTVANLAVAAVDARKTVLVVSADLRSPTIHSFFGVVPGPGLTDVVAQIEENGIDAIDLDEYLAPTSVLGATLIRSGHPVAHPGERLALALPFIEKARSTFDVIIIDTPAMLLGNDVNEIIPAIDLVLLVAKAGKTTLEEAEWSNETAERLRAPVCGVALVGSSSDLQRRNRLMGLLSKVKQRFGRGRPSADDDFAQVVDGAADATPPTASEVPASVEPSAAEPQAAPDPTGPISVQTTVPASVETAVPASVKATPAHPPLSDEELAATTITMPVVPSDNGAAADKPSDTQQPTSALDNAIAEAANTLAAKTGRSNQTPPVSEPVAASTPTSPQPEDTKVAEPVDDTGPLPAGQTVTAQSETQAQSEPEPEPKAETQTQAEPEPEPEPETKTETQTQAEPEPGPEPQAETETETQADTETESETLSASEFLAGLDLGLDPSLPANQPWPPPAEAPANFAEQTIEPLTKKATEATPAIPGLGDPTLEFPRVDVENGEWLRIVDKSLDDSLDLTLIDEDEDVPNGSKLNGGHQSNGHNGK